MNHAPSKIILDQIYILQKVLKKEVLLIISPIPFTEENFFTWYQPFIPNYDEKMEKKNFSFLYKGVSINGYQLNLCSENLNIYQNLMSIIYDFNPLFIYGHGSYLAWEDMMSQFTTVISKEMSSHYPVSEAQILLGYKGINQNTVQNELDFIKNNKQISFDFNHGIELEKPKTLLTRDDYHIEKDDFVIVIVGNRLNEEITNEYAEFLNKILELHQRIKIAFIGKYFACPVTEDNKDKIIYLGYQNDLPGAYHIADIYLNPPRKGGGISGLLAIHNGIPVITLPDNDVSNNVGYEFTCNSNDEILKIVLKYMNDESFYESQKQKGFEVTQKLYSEDAGLGQFIEDIKNVIRQAEVGA
jgi:glycosyltransferase involved in cell wall biosynthesis